ncbi:MAG: C40 family peptidase [Gemmatimonadaceae bacterium]|nr:C40 family peptidase [Chitinophagaceae bacterium]
MLYAVCSVPLAPIYKQPGFLGEMSSQLLFGEQVTVTDTSGKLWLKIDCNFDGYTGWITRHQVTEIDRPATVEPLLVTELLARIEYQGSAMHIPLGSDISSIDYRYIPAPPATENESDTNKFVRYAMMLLNAPYLWGGRSILGIDCSGFVQVVFKLCGIPLLRDAHEQATQGEAVNFLQEVIPGDLAFFENEDGLIIHVGMLLDTHSIIHAAGKVRIDKIDNHGIVNAETGERTHKLRIIKRMN